MSHAKHSGFEWVGEIPNGWGMGRISHRFKLTLGKMVEPDAGFSDRAQYPYLCAANLKWQKVDTSIQKVMHFTSQERRHYEVHEGDLLITEGGSIGTSCIYNGEFGPVCYMQNSVIRARGKNLAANKFLAYWLEFVCNSGYLDVLCNKATIAHYTKDKVGKTPFPLMREHEYEVIVDAIDGTCTPISNTIEALEGGISILERYRASVIHEAVTKGLDPAIPTKPSGVDWIGSIPSSWVLEKLNNVAELYGRIGWQGLTADEYQDEGPWLVTGTDFKDGKVDWNTCVHISEKRWEEAYQIKLQSSDLLITKDGTVGKLAIVENQPGKASLNSGIMRVVPRSESDYSTKYLYYVLQTDVFKEWFKNINAGASTIQHLFQKDFKHFVFPKPPLQKQIAIANYLDNKCATIDAILDTKRNQIDILKRRRQSLIYEYVTGKRRVRQEL